jgi:hypothetical protein
MTSYSFSYAFNNCLYYRKDHYAVENDHWVSRDGGQVIVLSSSQTDSIQQQRGAATTFRIGGIIMGLLGMVLGF